MKICAVGAKLVCADRHDEDNSCFSQFSKCTYKCGFRIYPYPPGVALCNGILWISLELSVD